MKKILEVNNATTAESPIQRNNLLRNNALPILIKGVEAFVDPKTIFYTEGDNKNTIMHTVDGKTMQLQLTLSTLYRKLKVCNFVQVHRSYIVNLAEVGAIDKDWAVIRSTKERIPIGRVYKKQFKAAHGNYMRIFGL